MQLATVHKRHHLAQGSHILRRVLLEYYETRQLPWLDGSVVLLAPKRTRAVEGGRRQGFPRRQHFVIDQSLDLVQDGWSQILER